MRLVNYADAIDSGVALLVDDRIVPLRGWWLDADGFTDVAAVAAAA